MGVAGEKDQIIFERSIPGEILFGIPDSVPQSDNLPGIEWRSILYRFLFSWHLVLRQNRFTNYVQLSIDKGFKQIQLNGIVKATS